MEGATLALRAGAIHVDVPAERIAAEEGFGDGIR
jgi:hypothetical protein